MVIKNCSLENYFFFFEKEELAAFGKCLFSLLDGLKRGNMNKRVLQLNSG